MQDRDPDYLTDRNNDNESVGKKVGKLLVIRLVRTGKRKQAYFRVVVAEKQKATHAKFVEILGNWDPHAKKLSVNSEKISSYIEKGACPSNSLAKLLTKEGFELPKWVEIKEKKKAPKEKKKSAAPTQKPQNQENKDLKGEPVEKNEAAPDQKEEPKEEKTAEEPSSEVDNKIQKEEPDSASGEVDVLPDKDGAVEAEGESSK